MDIKVEKTNRSGELVSDSAEAMWAEVTYDVNGTIYSLLYEWGFGKDILYCSAFNKAIWCPGKVDPIFPCMREPVLGAQECFIADKPGHEIVENILSWEKMSPLSFKNSKGDMSMLIGIDKIEYEDADEYAIWDEYEDEDGFEKIWAAIIEFCKEVKDIYEKHQK